MKSTCNVLLVEDDEDDQYFFKEAITEISNVSLIHIAPNGESALTELESSSNLPDIIFMDIDLPGMTGIDCLAAIINIPHLKNIPVVMLSSSVHFTSHALAAGAKGFIEKNPYQSILKQQLDWVINEIVFIRDPPFIDTAMSDYA